MFRNISISTKITLVVTSLVILSVLAISFISWSVSRKETIEQYGDNINSLADLKSEEINLRFWNARQLAHLIASSPSVQEALGGGGSGEAEMSEDESMDMMMEDESMDMMMEDETMDMMMEDESMDMMMEDETMDMMMEDESMDMMMEEPASGAGSFADISRYAETFPVSNVVMVNRDGLIMYQLADSESFKLNTELTGVDWKKANTNPEKITFSSDYKEEGKDLVRMYVPVTNQAGFAGLAVLILDLTPVMQEIRNSWKDNQSLEILLGRKEFDRIEIITPMRFDSLGTHKRIVVGDERGKPMQLALQGGSDATVDQDYRGSEVLSAYRYLPDAELGLVVKIDVDEINQAGNSLLVQYLIIGLILVILSTAVSTIFSRFLINPLMRLNDTMNLLSKGVLPSAVNGVANDEIGQMSHATNELVESLKEKATFAQYIGQGQYDADFTPSSEKDTLGNALIDMRESIRTAEKQDQERNWIITGQAEIGEILREHDNLSELGDAIIAYITEKIDAIQGAFYVVNDDEADNPVIEMKSSYAYHKKKHLEVSFKFAEGLIGQAAIEQDTLLRTEIPNDYVSLTSGLLGEQRPTCLLIVPLITNEKVFGVLEFAGITKFNERQVRFVQEISLIIARTIFNIKVNERTRMLLAESQQMSNELQEKQEVLRQNAEEMEATQEELKRTNTRLEDQIQEVNRTQKRMQVLLENASEVITIYEADGNVRYISPSVERILGYTQSELMGKAYEGHLNKEDLSLFGKMFRKLLDNPDSTETIQIAYRKQDGVEVMLEAKGKNMIDDPAIQGIVVNSTDITERLRAEKEERMRSQMQSLSENSPDLITRLTQDGEFFYINPTIENLTGQKPDHYLNKKMSEVELSEGIVAEWEKIMEEVASNGQKVSREMDFDTKDGDHIMQVNAIPEYNEKDEIESVLMVSHDVTSRKLIELEIQNKNKKITESINYAQRIQGAILPNNRVVHRALPDSFIFYKAKDVVSGDFPWFLQKGDDIFIAAVDCTGHGVPGALISLIGYFLLNDIIRSRGIHDPGQALDVLDEGVTQTLRQDTDENSAKDGMDIALVRINLKKKEMHFSGAHRPLYYVDQGEMVEIKGNKFAIGGGRYKNQTNFTTHEIKFKEGDCVYFCSDGYPDQFGGPDNRKFGPKRTRALIMESYQKTMLEQHDIFEKEWTDWQGVQKQTDDVLMIGIKF